MESTFTTRCSTLCHGKNDLPQHKRPINNILRAPMSFHATVDSGITLNRFSEDIRLIDVELPTAAFGVAISMFNSSIKYGRVVLIGNLF